MFAMETSSHVDCDMSYQIFCQKIFTKNLKMENFGLVGAICQSNFVTVWNI